MVEADLAAGVVLAVEREPRVVDLQLAVGDGYPLVEEGVGVRFEDRLRQSLKAADKTGKDYARKERLIFRRLPRLRQIKFEERDGVLELMKPMVKLDFENIDLRAEEMQVIKAEDVYTARQVKLSEEQKRVIEAEHGRKVALSLLLRGRVEGEEERYHDVMFLIYEDEVERKIEAMEVEVGRELDNKLAQGNGFWILGRNDFEVIDEGLKEAGVSLRQEDKLSNQMKGLYKRAKGEYQQKVLLTEFDYELFNVDSKKGEMSLALTGFNDYGLYEKIRDDSVRLMIKAQASETGVALAEDYERVTADGGGLSGVTTNETEDILEKTAVDRDGNVWKAFKQAPTGEMFSDDQVLQEVRNLENQIMNRIKEVRQGRNEVLSVEPREWVEMFLGDQVIVGSGEIEEKAVIGFDWPVVEIMTSEVLEFNEVIMAEEDWIEAPEWAGELTETYSSQLGEEGVTEEAGFEEVESQGLDVEPDDTEPEEPEPGDPGGLALRPKTEIKQASWLEELKEEVEEKEGMMVIKEERLGEKRQEGRLREEASYELGQEVTEEEVVEERVVYQTEVKEETEAEEETEAGEGNDRVDEGMEVPEWEVDWAAMEEVDVPVWQGLELSVPVSGGLEAIKDGVEVGEMFFAGQNWSMFEYCYDFSCVAVALLYAMLGNKLVRLRVPVEGVGGVVRQQRVI